MIIIKHLILISSLIVCGCTENQRARNFGGNMTVNVERGQKVVNVTWKGADLWILTRPMRVNETAEVLTFKENTKFGMLEGKVTLEESR